MSSYSIGGTTLKFVSVGSDYRIEKSSSTIGYARKANGDWRIEYGSSSIGWVRTSRKAIESFGGSTLSSVSSAPGGSSNPDYVVGAFYLFKKEGKI